MPEELWGGIKIFLCYDEYRGSHNGHSWHSSQSTWWTWCRTPWDLGHFQHLQSHFWWPDIEANVKYYIKACDICQHVKIPWMQAGGPANSLPVLIPRERSSTLLCFYNFFVGLPPSQHGVQHGVSINQVLLSFHSSHSHSVKYYDQPALGNQRRIVSVYWVLLVLITYWGSLFNSQQFQWALYNLGVNYHVTTTGHPQTNGIAEGAVNLAKATLKTLRDQQCCLTIG